MRFLPSFSILNLFKNTFSTKPQVFFKHFIIWASNSVNKEEIIINVYLYELEPQKATSLKPKHDATVLHFYKDDH